MIAVHSCIEQALEFALEKHAVQVLGQSSAQDRTLKHSFQHVRTEFRRTEFFCRAVECMS